ncbi:endoglucanase-like [Diabrotica undecimpunctata]|uniref:endoglucanase-like n=1 Tax=Diabrotica undecimpunctata TaxID=50387 RepID=UPI003B63F52E
MKFVVAFLLLNVYASAESLDTEPLEAGNVIIEKIPGGLSGSGTTTRYWDCCKPTCSWPGNVNYKTPVKSCQADGITAINSETQSGCVGGAAYVCTNQAQRSVNDSIALGFVAAKFINTKRNMCCSCIVFRFKPAELAHKQMVLQVTNTGNDDPYATHNEFDIAMPGSGVGYYTQGCSSQWNADVSKWGDQYGGVHNIQECHNLPTHLQPGCEFRFNWMNGYSNPDVTFDEVVCPKRLTDISGCYPASHP